MTTAQPDTDFQPVPDLRKSETLHSSSLSSLASLYLLSLRQHLHGKRWIVIGFLFLLPAGLAMLIRLSGAALPSIWLEFLLAFMFIPQALLPLVALIYSSGILQDEQEDQTITYLLIRPIPKWALYIVKLLGAITTCIALTTIFTALTYAAIFIGSGDSPPDILHRCATAVGIHCLAVFCYCCLFGVMSLLTQRILIVGIMYIAIIEGFLANLPFSIRLITVIYYTRVIAYRALPFLAPTPDEMGRKWQPLQNVSADAWQLDIANDPNLLLHPQSNTCVTILLIASLAFILVAAFLCSRREFHVKTPEKN